ncbi:MULTISPECIES: hypothetical protein [Cyanophyceae]|uniref:hypothetical protein n=1 Tax=Cyanophyceae TaxID=3028117 RepID=UPI001685C4A3|nr:MULTISPECIES: hypothetical protein [Cyanophyceae]MBD1914582.1 hypothetical protein [Phormidium sp. FACHB-77]MBD2030306.1 hypothetical protein [Phormidium sp. FACHB-322]MBD2049852.1 hypothetical protein [Leptolyngbya sp. FACHB-60]
MTSGQSSLSGVNRFDAIELGEKHRLTPPHQVIHPYNLHGVLGARVVCSIDPLH